MGDSKALSGRKYSGIVICIAFAIMFILADSIMGIYFGGVIYHVIKSALMILFFVVELFVYLRFYGKESAGEIIYTKDFLKGIKAGFAIFLYIPFVIVTYFVVGKPAFANTTIPIVLSYLVLEQLAASIFEEFSFRVFVCEGYFLEDDTTSVKRIEYALVSAVTFGLAHAATATTLNSAAIRFCMETVWGFAFAAVYLYSHNILAAMLLHFFTDVVINSTNLIKEWTPSDLMTILDNYGYFVVMGIILVMSVIVILRQPERLTQ